MSSVGERIRQARERMGWSQGRIARSMQAEGHPNFHQTTISRIEKGERPVTTDECAALGRVLGSSPIYLAGWSPTGHYEQAYQRGYQDGVAHSIKRLEGLL